ncbi:DUF1523 family protein [Litoreibacter arenae]|uniref:DUF1523 domain-containing protein n=1 Tax=Litoreibacter arenae DSM 19593 TaxID=1123360 RepID=S9QGU9_9RHOB|nr:DUF1523 family protein [Litoreibacter arenae]EPX80651.1 hypothetical protein thalar_00871 [Litoreibacter arenae DSM 19593]
MLRWVKYTIVVLFWLLVASVLHYTLPQRDVVRVVGTFEQRIDYGENSWFWASGDSGSDVTGTNRDVLFIQTIRQNGKPMVYRNEDTSWGWPPYFKFDTKNLQTEAADLISTKADPQWAVLTHYGWRNEFYSIFPNAVGIRATDDPDATLIPWLNIVILVILAGICLGLFRLLQWFKRSKIDPIAESVGETWDSVDDYADERRSGFRAWLDTWKGKPRR